MFLIASSFGVSVRLCVVIMAFPGYLYSIYLITDRSMVVAAAPLCIGIVGSLSLPLLVPREGCVI